MIIKSECGMANLLGAILERDPDDLKVRLNLPTKPATLNGRPCLNCGKLTPNLKYCSRDCQFEYTHIRVVCDECGTEFRRFQSTLIRRIGKDEQKFVFCSRRCNGKFTGRNYGFVVKHDYKAVFNLQAQGYRPREIARLLNIPYGSIYYVCERAKQGLVNNPPPFQSAWGGVSPSGRTASPAFRK